MRVTVSDLVIPTYGVGPADPLPPLFKPRVYPYPMQTALLHRKSRQRYQAVTLENEFIRVVVLPRFGGKVHAAFDKTDGGADFLYHNRVIKPGLVGLRGAWLSGGIEWNFPSLGHTTNTFSPVPYHIVRHADGAISCVVGTTEWVRRMRWVVWITVRPGQSQLEHRAVLTNRGLTPRRAYYWANGAVHVHPDTRVTFPATTRHVFSDGQRGAVWDWPLHQGKDLSLASNTHEPFEYFSARPAGFVAVYHPEAGRGTVHFTDQRSAGKKFFTWGTARDGGIWEDLLTDQDGSYLELQSGHLLTQGDTWIFPPQGRLELSGAWYPVKGLGAVQAARAAGAMNLELTEGGVSIAINVTRRFNRAQAELLGDGRRLWSQRVSLSPRQGLRERLPSYPGVKVLRLVLRDEAGRVVLDHSTESPPRLPPELRAPPWRAKGEAQWRYQQAMRAFLDWKQPRAEELLRVALQADAAHRPSHLQLGLMALNRGLYSEATRSLSRALELKDTPEVRFFHVLARSRGGEGDAVISAALAPLVSGEHPLPAAAYLAAGLAIKGLKWQQAERLLRSAARSAGARTRPRVMLAAVLRRSGRGAAAAKLLETVLRDDPLSPLALVERHLGGAPPPAGLIPDVQHLLEVAADYLEVNLLEEALASLETLASSWSSHPMVQYWRAFLWQRKGDARRAGTLFDAAARASEEGIFPFRPESERVLRAAIQHDPGRWRSRYYLGLLLASKQRWSEAQRQLHGAEALGPRSMVLYWVLAQVHRHHLYDRARASGYYRHALKHGPSNVRLYVELDQLLEAQGDHGPRRALLFEAPPAVQRHQSVKLRQALLLIQRGDPGRAIKILRSNRFYPWEGWSEAYSVYLLALHRRIDQSMAEGAYKQATEDLKAAMEYPENLGSGRPAKPDHSREFFKLGQCAQAKGDAAGAARLWKRVLTGEAPMSSPSLIYHIKALRAVGREVEAKDLLDQGIRRWEKRLSIADEPRASHLYSLGLLYRMVGRPELSRLKFTRAVAKDPAHHWARQALDPSCPDSPAQL